MKIGKARHIIQENDNLHYKINAIKNGIKLEKSQTVDNKLLTVKSEKANRGPETSLYKLMSTNFSC